MCIAHYIFEICPDSKARWKYVVGPTWSRQVPRRANVGPTKFAVGAMNANINVKLNHQSVSRLIGFTLHDFHLNTSIPTIATLYIEYWI